MSARATSGLRERSAQDGTTTRLPAGRSSRAPRCVGGEAKPDVSAKRSEPLRQLSARSQSGTTERSRIGDSPQYRVQQCRSTVAIRPSVAGGEPPFAILRIPRATRPPASVRFSTTSSCPPTPGPLLPSIRGPLAGSWPSIGSPAVASVHNSYDRASHRSPRQICSSLRRGETTSHLSSAHGARSSSYTTAAIQAAPLRVQQHQTRSGRPGIRYSERCLQRRQLHTAR